MRNEVKKRVALGALIAAVAVSVLMLVLEPVPGGRHYEYALLQSLALVAIGLLYTAAPRTFFGKEVLLSVMLCGLVMGAINLMVLSPKSEIVQTYRTVFEAIESGANPYTSGTIHHEIEDVGTVLGNFNYPPLEIYPYYLAYRIAGTWNIAVLTVTILLIQALCCVILFLAFPHVPPVYLLAFVPMILLGELKTNVAMTLLVTALVLWMIKRDAEKPREIHGPVIAILFGLGLMTKFLVLPLMAAYYAHQFDAKDHRSIAGIVVDVFVAVASAVLVMAPFGIINVIKSTLLFNVVLEDRAVMTTFYPNVLSGPLAWIGLQALYPIAAGVLLGLAVLSAPRLGLFTAMVTASIVFLVVAPTPEPQFISPLLFLVVVARCMEQGNEGLGGRAELVPIPDG